MLSTNDLLNGGELGIRTLEGLASLSVFKTDAFDHSANSPLTLKSNILHQKKHKISLILNQETITNLQRFQPMILL